MAISLSKGQNLSLSKAEPGLKKIIVGLGWDPRATDGKQFDLDASIFMLNESGKVRNDADFIFYGQMASSCKSVVHTGDNRTGEGDGDDESIKVDLSLVPVDINRLVITVTIDKAAERGQSFGQVGGAFVRIVNEDAKMKLSNPDMDESAEVVKYDLSEDYSTETAMVFGEIYRHNSEWKFKAVGQGYAGGLMAMCKQFGIDASA